MTKYYDSMLKTPDIFDTLRLFDDLYGTSWTTRSKTSTAAAYRTEIVDDGLVLSIDLPGVKSKDLSVQVTGRDVKVSGKHRGEEFKQTYKIAKEYDPETVSATLEDGVLTLSFKKSVGNETKTIEVKVK